MGFGQGNIGSLFAPGATSGSPNPLFSEAAQGGGMVALGGGAVSYERGTPVPDAPTWSRPPPLPWYTSRSVPRSVRYHCFSSAASDDEEDRGGLWSRQLRRPFRPRRHFRFTQPRVE